MEHSTIKDWVKNSQNMDKYSHRELKFLIDKYPFFEVAHLLLLKNLNDSKSIRFKEELKNSSLHISNRRQLFLLLNDRLSLRKFQNEKADDLLSEDLSISDIESSKIDELESVESVSKSSIKDEMEEQFADTTDAKGDDIFELSETAEIEETLVQSDFVLNSDIEILELSENENSKDDLEDQKIEEISKEDLLISATEVYHIGYGGNLYTLADDDQQEEISKDKNHSFTDWIEVVNKDEDLKQKQEEDSPVKRKKTTKSKDLIDNFIQNEPNIQRNVKVADKQEDISLDSIRDNDGFMSETLASIYVKQRLFDKAVAVYEKLVLKYPEKNAYFASQIEKIEKLKNSK
ncbi:hypothetical protein [Marinifilum sp. N1E240]|uniref:hypothetical protein n=1 Tax=Marinifilum sp. N1E240 TaxID=2608082 RepID=UPI00128B48BA|nr:hypothetical protein [Marinifilum sp. N1E240]